MSSTEDDDTLGVRFGPLIDELSAEEFPMEKSELLETYGEYELELVDGTQSLEEILGPIDQTTFESPEEISEVVVGMVGKEAIGREHYSDRGSEPLKEERSGESF